MGIDLALEISGAKVLGTVGLVIRKGTGSIVFKYGDAFVNNMGDLYIGFQVPNHLKKKGLGSEMFDTAIKEFGDKVVHIKGRWTNTPELNDNYNTFINNLKEMEEDEAIWSRFTGKQALKHGFNKIVSVDHNKRGESIEVLFGK